jgi:hypothetical protein
MAEERDLHEAFRALREAEAARRPSFEGVLERPVPRPRALPVSRTVTLALAFAGLFVLVLVLRSRAPRSVHEDLWAWNSPTRSLLPPPDAGTAAVPRLGETWGAPAPEPEKQR